MMQHSGESGAAQPFVARPGMVLAPEVNREALIAHIASKLGSLSAIYADAIRSSAETGCYDTEWAQGEPYMRIERYIAGLRRDWLAHKGDTSVLVERLLYLQEFGGKKEKAMLVQLGLMNPPKEGDNGA